MEEEQSFQGKVSDLSKFKELDGINVYCEIKDTDNDTWLITGRARSDIDLSDLNKFDFVIYIEEPYKIFPT